MSIKVYSRVGCVRCVALKQKFLALNVPFEELEVGVDVTPDFLSSTYGAKSIPVVVSEGQLVVNHQRFLEEYVGSMNGTLLLEG